MADKDLKLPENRQELIEKWLPVIELKDKWQDKVGDAPKIANNKYGLMAEQLEAVEQLVISEKNVAGDVAVYNPILIPMIRRIIPSIIGPEIFGTQPMKQSTGLVFYLRSLYTGNNDADLKFGLTKSAILLMSTVNGLAKGATITTGSDEGVVKYVEGPLALIAVTTGDFTGNDGAASVITIASSDATVSSTVTSVYTNEQNYLNILKNYTGPWDTSVTSYAVNQASSAYETHDHADINELGITIEQQSIVAKVRKLKARWTREIEEDLKNSHSLNVEQLLTQVASEEIIREQNREFIGILDDQCTVVNSNVYTVSYGGLDGRWELEKYQNLCAVISRVRRQVALRNRRGQANFMIVTPLALAILEATGKLSSEGVDPIATNQAGTFMNMKVYVDLWANDTTPTIWLGYKGSEVDAGYFYCPYVPLRVDKGIGQEDAIPRLFFSTRYATAPNNFGSHLYYSKIQLNGFPGMTIA
jgi:hypothetical protein